MKHIYIIFLSFLLPLSIGAQITQVTVTEAQDLLKDGYLLIDVREASEVDALAYHVQNIQHIPLSELAENYSEIPMDKNLIVACRSGGRSAKAIKQLKALGYENLSNLKGGILDWQAKGFPVVVEKVAPDVAAVGSMLSKNACSKSSAKAGKSCCSGKAGNQSEAKKGNKSCCSKSGKTDSKSCSKEETSACCSKKKT